MAGKPEQPISHPASQNHIHQQHYQQQQYPLHLQQQQHHHHHHHQVNRRNIQSNQQHIPQPQETQGIQQNSVLVYVPGDNFAYTTAIGHNNADGSTGGYQTSLQQQPQQTPYQGVLPQVAATQQTFPAKTSYNVAETPNVIGEVDNEIESGINCCHDKSIGLINCNVISSNKQQSQQHKDDDEYNSTNYRTSGLINGRATGSPSNVNKIDIGALTSNSVQINNNSSNNNVTSEVRSPGQSDADSLSSASDSGIVATASTATRSALPSSAVTVSGGGDNNNHHHHHNINKTFPQTHYEAIVSCGGSSGGDSNSGYSISQLPDNYSPNGGNTSLGGVNENNFIANNIDDNSCLSYIRHNGGVHVSAGIYSLEIDSPSQQHEIIGNKTRVIHQDSLDLNDRGCYNNKNNTSNGSCTANNNNNNQVRGIEVGCESVRSDAGESVYSSSSLSSPECQSLQQSVGVDQGVGGNSHNNNNKNNSGSVVCVQQAAHLVSQINVQHSNNVALTMNGSAVTHHQQKQQQQAIAAPCGWKRICTNGVIIYISPSSTALGSLDQLKEYLTTAGTCKCGLECPLRPEQVFNFDPKVATRPWSPDQGKTREMTTLCNHKRKLLLPVAAASPVASCTPVVSSSTLFSPGAPVIHANADSPTSSDKLKKDGLNKKKKRKLGSVGNLYSGVSVSQLLAQRERAIVAGATGVQESPSANGSQIWPMTALPIQQNNQQIGHQLLNSPSQNIDSNACVVRNSQQRLNQHNMTSMLMGNPLIMNQQSTNFNNMTQQQQLMQQHMTHHQNLIPNQLSQQQQSHYINQLSDQSIHQTMPQQHLTQQQQMHIQQMQKHNGQQQLQSNNQETNQQQVTNFNTHHTNDNFIHHMQTTQNSSQNQPIQSQMHQLHQHPMQYQQQSNQHMMQHQPHEQFHMLQHQQQMSQQCQPMQFNNQNINHHSHDIAQQSNNGAIMSGINSVEIQMRHNRTPSMNDDDLNAKQISQQQLMMHNPHTMQRHHIGQNGNQNLNHENMQRIYSQHQTQFQSRNNCDQTNKTSAIIDTKSGHHHHHHHHHHNHQELQQQYALVSQTGRTPTSGNIIEVQSIISTNGTNGQTNNHQFNQRTQQMWQHNRTIAPSHQPQTSPVSIQNITCNSLDRVPPLHHHIPPTAQWTDEVARKRAKPSKSLTKKRHQHNIGEIRNIEQSSPGPGDDFNDKSQSNNQIGSTLNNNSPSFLDDPSGYLAQQTALLNSTISRQTGVSSSQMMVINGNNGKIMHTNHQDNLNGNNYNNLPHQKPSSATSPTSSSVCNSVKNHATSPVVVHSSMTPTAIGSNTNASDNGSCQGCVTSADTQLSYMSDHQYKQQIHRQYVTHADQRDDPVTSSTFGDRHFASTQQLMDSSWPIQGGTISTSHGSPVGNTNSPANSETPPSSISQPTTPQSLISSQPSTPHSYSQPPTPLSQHSSIQIPPQSLTPVGQQPSQSSNINNTNINNNHHNNCNSNSSSSSSSSSSNNNNIHNINNNNHNSSSCNNSNIHNIHNNNINNSNINIKNNNSNNSNNNANHDQTSNIGLTMTSSTSSMISPSNSPSQTSIMGSSENMPQHSLNHKKAIPRQPTPDGYQPHPHTLNSSQRISAIPYSGNSTIITTMASGHTYSCNTITSVLAGKANTATVSINTPSGIPNAAIPNILSASNKSHLPLTSTQSNANMVVTSSIIHPANSTPMVHSHHNTIVSKSPLEMVQSVVSSIQVPQPTSGASLHQQQTHQQQSNVQVHNVLTSGGMLKHSSGSTLPPGHILVSSGGQLIMASTGTGISGVMAPPPPKIISNTSAMPPLSVSPMVTSVTGTVSQVIPAVGVAQQVIGQPTVLVNTIQTPVLIQPSVMTMDGIGQNVQIPHLTVATGNVLQNTQSIMEANQDVTRTVTTNQSIVNRQSALLSPEATISKKKVYKKRKSNSQTVASMLHIASSQQNTGMLMQSQSNFAQQNFQTQSIGGPMLQALTIVPGKGGAPAQLVMNGQTGATSAQFNTQQIITNPQPTQQINLLQPVNLLNGATGMMQNFPTIQQFIVPGLGSMVMSADGTATLLQDTGNLGMQLQIQNVNGQNVLTPVQSHSGIFSPSQSILAAGPAGMVIRAPQTAGGKLIQQHGPGTQFLSSNSGQFLVNGTTSFGNQLSPIVANVSPNQQMTFNTSQVRPTNIQGQQEFIQMNGQTLMVPCATAQNIAVSSAPNQQNTTFVQQNTTIVQQQTTMVSNNQIPDFQTVTPSNNNGVDQSQLNLDHNQSFILSTGMIQNNKSLPSPKRTMSSPTSEQNFDQLQQFNLTSSNITKNNSNIIEQNNLPNDQHSPSMVRHSVSTQTAGNQANNAQSTIMRQGSPPDTTTHSPGTSQRSNSPAVDTTTHGAASPAPSITTRNHSSTPMVHCISSSEPDSGEVQVATDDWRIHGIATKEITLSQGGVHGKTFVESTVTTGIQIYTPETLKQTEGVVSTMRCEGRGIKRKLDSIHSMHSTLHEDQDVSVDESNNGNDWKVKVGELVWGAALGSPAWPGKVESLGPTGSLTVWVRWYGIGGTLTQVDIKNLKSLSDGLEAHHRARKRFRKSRKLNMQLENAIQEAMAELDNITSDIQTPRKVTKQPMKSSPARSSKSATSSSTMNSTKCSERKTPKKLLTADSQKPAPKCW